MKSRSILTSGVLATTQAFDGSTTVQQKVAYKEVFSVNSDTKGDRKHPTAHGFTRSRCSGVKGTRWNVSPSIFATNTVEGVFRSADLYPDYVETGWESRLYNAAISKLNDETRGGIDISVDSAQAGQTAKMVKAVFAFRSYVKDFVREFRRIPPRAIGSKWLEYQYGWKPTLSTIYEAASEIHNPATRLGVFKVRVSERSERRDVVVNFFPGCNEIATRTVKLGCEMKVWVRPPESSAQEVARFSSLNPVSIAWELLPYSFVIDWFVNLGGYIRDLETAMLYRSLFESGYVCYTSKVSSEHVACGAGMNGSQYAVMNAHGSWESISKRRDVLQSYPFPRLPPVRAELGSGRLLNAAALLSQFLGTR